MSGQGEEPLYDIPIDKVAMIAVVRAIEQAYAYLRTDDTRSAVVETDLAWTLLPPAVRRGFEMPSRANEKKTNAELPTVEALSVQPEFQGASRFTVEGYRNGLLHNLTNDMIRDSLFQFVDEADRQGLYVGKGSHGFPEPTGRRNATQTPPKEKPYSDALSREVDSNA